jgi:23S rRNA pseudouridine1911/1915/1917 synthase
LNKLLFEVEESGERLDLYLAHYLSSYSRTQIQKWIRNGSVTVGGVLRRPSYPVQEGEWIEVHLPELETEPATVPPQEIPLDIVYEDRDIAVINKPPGLVVHPGTGNRDGTLVNALVYHFQSLSTVYGSQRPGIVHRLDRDTSGLMVIAKNNPAHSGLAEQFRSHRVEKTYIGVTWGVWEPSTGWIEAPIARKRKDPTLFTVDPAGRPAQTYYSVLHPTRYLSIVAFHPKTGRTHQIRVHAASQNHPLFGDERYGGGSARVKGYLPEVSRQLKQLLRGLGRQALHASHLAFDHPVTGERMAFQCDPPADMLTVFEALEYTIGNPV